MWQRGFQGSAGNSKSSSFNGGAEGDRTPDLRIANATLSQLSYGPDLFEDLRPDLSLRFEGSNTFSATVDREGEF
jgi:hypothetical protein